MHAASQAADGTYLLANAPGSPLLSNFLGYPEELDATTQLLVLPGQTE